MPIRCHAENDGQGVVLGRIEMMADAESLRCFFAEQGIAAIITQPREEAGFRVYVPGMPLGLFAKLIAKANVELID